MAIADLGSILASTAMIGGTYTETAVAKAWLTKHANDYDRVEFNVLLGPGMDVPPGTPSYLVTAANNSTKSRADMVAWLGATPSIVEVKDRAYPSVLGQLLTYWHLMRADNPKLLQVYKIVAAQTVVDGMMPVFEAYNVQVELFPSAAAAAGIKS